MISEIALFSLSSTYVSGKWRCHSNFCERSFLKELEHKFGDFQGKRLSHFTFDKDWETWEMHPAGEEFVFFQVGSI